MTFKWEISVPQELEFSIDNFIDKEAFYCCVNCGMSTFKLVSINFENDEFYTECSICGINPRFEHRHYFGELIDKEYLDMYEGLVG